MVEKKRGFRCQADVIFILLIVFAYLALFYQWHAFPSYWLIGCVMSMFVSVVACSMGVVAATAWGRCNIRRAFGLLVACMVCFVVAFYCLTAPTFEAVIAWFSGARTNFISVPKYGGKAIEEMLICGLIAVPILAVAVWAGVVLLRFAPPQIKRFAKRRFKFKFKWRKVLVGVVICLLVAGFARNLIQTFGLIQALGLVGVSRFVNGMVSLDRLMFVVSSLAGVGLFLVFVFWPSWSLTKNRSWRNQSFVWLVVFGASLGGIYSYYRTIGIPTATGYPSAMFYTGSLGVGVLLFLLTLSAVGDREGESCRNANVDSSPGGEPARLSGAKNFWMRKSWVAIPLLGIVCLVYVPVRYDTSILFSKEPLADRFVLSRKSGKLSWATGGQVSLDIGRRYLCHFNESTPSNIFSAIEFEPPIHLIISNMNPRVDTRLIRDMEKRVVVKGGTMTSGQIEDMMKNASLSGFDSVSVTGQGDPILFGGPHTVTLGGNFQPGEIGAFLDRFGEIPSGTRFVISAPVAPGDYAGIAKFSSDAPVVLTGGLADISLTAKQNSLKYLYVDAWRILSTQSGLTASQSEVLQKSDMILTAEEPRVGKEISNNQNYWDVRFAFPRRFSIRRNTHVDRSLDVSLFTSKFDVTSASKKFHWAFGVNEADEVTELFFPKGGNDLAVLEFPELKVLSFDDSWIRGKQGRGFNFRAGAPPTYSHLVKLTKLESLYFPAYAMGGIQDFAIVKSLPTLKHLQILAATWSPIPVSKFEFCQSLESITFIGDPAPADIKALARLPNLKKILVDWPYDGPAGQTALDNFRKTFPAIEVIANRSEDPEFGIPDSFKQHLKRLEGPLRKKLSDRAR